MIRRPPRSTLTYTLFPDTTLLRSTPRRCATGAEASRSTSPAGHSRRQDGGAASLPFTERRRRVMAATVLIVEKNGAPGTNRSEEHTSELQSLMRTSYAVLCLKKKTQT